MDARIQNLPFDAVALHQLQSASLGGDGAKMEPAMQLALDANFGSALHWREAFVACARARAGGSDGVRLVFRPREGTLVNQAAADHTQAVDGSVPILALDLTELAYRGEDAAAAGRLVEAFMDNIDWAAVYGHYQRAVHAASESLGLSPDEIGDALVLDVRRAGVHAQAPTMIPGARWCDPAAVATWFREMPVGRDLVVYCVHGHEVSRATALRLRSAGLNARFLRGGLAAWQAAGRPLADKPAGQTP